MPGTAMNSKRVPGRFLLPAGILLLFFCTTWPVCPVSAQATQSGIVIEQPVMTIEAPVVEGSLIEHAFKVLNTGRQPLEIKSVRTSCGCVIADFDRRIAPGGSGRVSLSFNTRGYRGESSHKALVTTTDSVQPKRMLQLHTTVIAAVKATPDRVFLQGFPENPLLMVITVTAATKEPLTMHLDAENSQIPDGVSYRIEIQPEKHTCRLTVTDTARTARTYRGRLVFDTGSAVRPKLVVPIFGRVKADISVYPKKIDFGTLLHRQSLKLSRSPETVPSRLQQSVMIRSNRKTGLILNKVDIDSSKFQVRIAPLIPNQAYRLTLTCQPNHIPPGVLNTEMVVHAECGKNTSALPIPVRVKIK